MDGKTTVKYLQNYIKQKDFQPELLKDYFLKLSEEVGELSRAMRKGLKGRRWSDYRFSLCVVISILGKIDARWHDFNPHDESSYDAFTTLSE